MTTQLEYYSRFLDLLPQSVLSFIRAVDDGDYSNQVEELDIICNERSFPIELAASLAYYCAINISNPDLQIKAIQQYLAMKCTEILNLQRTSSISCDEIFNSIKDCSVPDQCRDLSLLMGRLLLADEHWYISAKANNIFLDWLR